MPQWSSEELHRTVVENLHDGVYVLDRQRKVLYWNPGAQRISGFASEEVLGRCCSEGILVHTDENGEKLCGARCPVAQTIDDGQLRSATVFLRHRSGHRVPVSVRVAPVRDPSGEICGAVETFSDDSQFVAVREKLEEVHRLAMADALTGLANRRFLDIALRARHDELVRYEWPFGVVILDIDHFKRVNDVHGHAIGDEVLKLVSRTLSASTRPSDTVGRWGGEEFVVVMSHADREGMLRMAERLRALIERSQLPEPRLNVTVSGGAALARQGEGLDDLLRRADGLLYRAKSDGRNRVVHGDHV